MKKKFLLMTCIVLMSAMASWAGQVFLDPSCFANGNVIASPSTANAGDPVTLTVTADRGYWIIAYVDPATTTPPANVLLVQETDQNGTPTSTPAFYVGNVNNIAVNWEAGPGTFTFTMPSTGYAKVTATFGLQPYPVTANNTINSSLNWVTTGLQDPPLMARMGDIITVTSTISGGYVLVDYLVMAHYSGYDVRIPVTSGQFVMPPASVDIYAIYKLPGSFLVYPNPIENTPFAIHIIPEHYGPSRIPCAMPGETVFLDLASIEGLDDIQVVGLSSGTIVPVYYKDLHYSFDMPAEDVEVTVTNQPPTGLPHDVFLHSNTGGTVRMYGNLPAIEHALIDMVIEPRAGYFVDNVSTDLLSGGPVLLYGGVDGNGNYNYTIEMPDHDVNVTVTFTAGNGYQVIVGPTTNGTVVSDYTNAMPHDRVTLTMTPNPGYMVAPGSVIVTERNPPYNQVLVFNGNNPDEYCFHMPSSDVDVTATFVLSSLVPYDVYTDPTTVNGIVEVVSIDGVTIPPGTLQPYTANAGVQVVVNDTPDPGYRLDFYELLDMSSVPLLTFTTNTFQMLPQDVIVSAKFVQNDYKVDVQSSRRGIADAWWNGIQLYDPVTNTHTPVHYQDVIELTCTPNPGYELDPGDPYRIYDGSIDITATVGLAWVGPGPNDYVFNMPASDVRVVPNYRLATFNVFVDQAIPGGIMDAYDRSNGQGGPFIQTFLATATDRIELSNTPNPPNSIAYYTVYDGNSNYIGDLLDFNPFNPTVFTMPPFDIQLTALFCAPPLPQPNNPIHMWTGYRGSIHRGATIYLHEVYMTKSERSGMWDRAENYGWSSAGPGELMYFTVVPDLGCKVKKSDITVQLVALTTIPGIMEEGECIDITDINGPDDEVTEPTDFSFIFTVPEGVDPGFVEVRIDADFDLVDYFIAVDMDAIEHGTVVAPDVAHVDDIVTLTVTPDPGYRLESITVTPEDPGFFVPVDENQFVMPACNVTVTATFEEADYQLGDVNNDGLVNVTDVTTLINAVLNENYDNIDDVAADLNGDGFINITDLTILINIVLNSQ